MKTITLHGILLIALAITFSSCTKEGPFCVKGFGGTTTEEIYVDDFEGIDLAIDADVKIIEGDNISVEIEGQQNVIDNIETEVTNGVWKIKYDRCVLHAKDVTIYITMPEIDHLHISGSGDIVTIGQFAHTDELDLEISGSGNLNTSLDANYVLAKISGSGNIDLVTFTNSIATKTSGSGNISIDGETNWLNVTISGSGDINTYGLETIDCSISISGSGNVEVNVANNLEVGISGSGDVHYMGNPSIDTSISGSGDIHGTN